jgi:hypothetical protein
MKMIQPGTRRDVPARNHVADLCHAIPAAPHAVARRSANLGDLATRSVMRATTNGAAWTAAMALHPGTKTWDEWFALQGAVAQRMSQLQQQWWQSWGEWLRESVQLGRANTLSEFAEQQYNLFAHAGALARDQASDLLNLQENVQVDCGYWATQKIHGAS